MIANGREEWKGKEKKGGKTDYHGYDDARYFYTVHRCFSLCCFLSFRVRARNRFQISCRVNANDERFNWTDGRTDRDRPTDRRTDQRSRCFFKIQKKSGVLVRDIEVRTEKI